MRHCAIVGALILNAFLLSSCDAEERKADRTRATPSSSTATGKEEAPSVGRVTDAPSVGGSASADKAEKAAPASSAGGASETAATNSASETTGSPTGGATPAVSPPARTAALVFEPLSVTYETPCFSEQSGKSVAVQTVTYKRVYSTKFGRDVTLRAYVFYPPGYAPDMGPASFPIAAMFHGGGLTGYSPMHLHGLAMRLASKNIIAVLFQYRVYNSFGDSDLTGSFKNAAYDAVSALRWVHKFAQNMGADANNIATIGDSAGGGLALMATLLRQTPDDSAADALLPNKAKITMVESPVLDTGAYGAFGPDHPLDLAAISPMHLMSATNQPPQLLILQGAKDDVWVTPPAKATAFCDKANSLSPHRCLLKMYPDYGHDFFADSGGPGWLDTVASFDEFLGWAEMAPPRADATVGARCYHSPAQFEATNNAAGYGPPDKPGGVW